MATNFQAQGHITVHRLRTGNTVSLSMTSVNALYQAYDPGSGDVSPNWNASGLSGSALTELLNKQPRRTPVLTAANGKAVTMDDAQWLYNGELLSFNGGTYAAGGSNVTDGSGNTYVLNTNASCAGKFAYCSQTKEIRLVGNLADPVNNPWNDTLTFKCKSVCDGIGTDQQLDLTIEIVSAGASSYRATLVVSSQILDSDHPSSTLTGELHLGLTDVQDFYMKVMGETTFLQRGGSDMVVHATSSTGGKAVATIYGSGNTSVPSTSAPYDDISGYAQLTGYFYLDSACTNLVGKASVEVTDKVDQYDVFLEVQGTNSQIADGQDVTLKAVVKDMFTGLTHDISGKSPIYDIRAYRSNNMTTPVKTSTTDTIVVSTAESDVGAELYDVEVTVEAQWTE